MMQCSCNLQPRFLVLLDRPQSIMNSESSLINNTLNDSHPFYISSTLPNSNKIDLNSNSKTLTAINSSSTEIETKYNNQPRELTSESTRSAKEENSPSESSANSSHNQRRKFSPEEDIMLSSAIAINGPRKWDLIALSLPGRTGRQCRDRFHNYLNPSLTNGPWTRDEDCLLEQKVYELGQHWNKIVKFFQGRSTNNIKNRWHTYICKRREGKVRGLSGKNMNKNRQKNENKVVDEVFSDRRNNTFVNDKINNNNISINSFNNISNNASNILQSFCENGYQEKKTGLKINNINHFQNSDCLFEKSKNEKKTIFPLICPPDNCDIFSSNQGIFNFLS